MNPGLNLTMPFGRVMRRNYFFSLNSARIVLPPKDTPPSQHSLLVDGLAADDLIEADRAIMGHFTVDAMALLGINQGSPK